MVWGKILVKDGRSLKGVAEVGFDDFRILDGFMDVLIPHTHEVKHFPLVDVQTVIKGSPDGYERKLEKRGDVSGLT